MSDRVESIELASPAKINLMLSVHGPQGDGFHALTSVVVALDFGDDLQIRRAVGGADVLRCSDPAVPTGMGNLIIKAAVAFREAVGEAVYFEFYLEKRIPMGAGLGGGSSNASTALLGMNQLLGEPLSRSALLSLAAGLGSDCPFFIDPRPSVMRGRGEQLDVLDEDAASRLVGQPLVLFRPHFGIETAWAYGQLKAQAPSSYESESVAAARLAEFVRSGRMSSLLFNSFESVVGRKYLALPCLLDDLRAAGCACLLSGSGSCCFAMLKDSKLSSSLIREICRNGWGDSVFWVETSVC